MLDASSESEQAVRSELNLGITTSKMNGSIWTQPSDPDEQVVLRTFSRANVGNLILVELKEAVRRSDTLSRTHTLVTVNPDLKTHEWRE